MRTKDIKAALSAKPKASEKTWGPKDCVSLGSPTLNIACSGFATGGIPKGVMLWMIGDSSTGKSWLKNTIFAEANINPAFDDYLFIDDNAERGALMDVVKYFGQETADRIIPPMGTMDAPEYSTTVQDMYYWLDDLQKQKKKFIAIVDSYDALTDEADDAKFEDKKRKAAARRQGKTVKETGTFGVARAKTTSQNLRRVTNRLMRDGSILVIISQTRANLGWDATFNPKTVAGGNALHFHNRLEFWMTVRETLKKRVAGKEREVGTVVGTKFSKNHITGWHGKTEFVFFKSSGVDAVGSCIRFLIEEGHWKASGGEEGRGLLKKKIHAKEFGETMLFNDLVTWIENEGQEKELRKIVKQVWEKIQSECEVPRKRRYR